MDNTELQERIDALVGMHNRYDRRRIRAVMNGGAEGVQAVLSWSQTGPIKEAQDLGVDLPTANIMWSGLERQAQRIGRMPTLKTDMIPTKDTNKARKMAEKRHRIVTGWDEMSRMELQFPQIGRWLPGYGFTYHKIREQAYGGDRYPVAELRDPFDVYPGYWGHDQQPAECVSLRYIPATQLQRIYPELIMPKPKAKGALPTSLGNSGYGNWENGNSAAESNYELAEYVNSDGTYIYCRTTMQLLSFIPNPLSSGPPFVVTKRFSFDRLVSQYHHVFGLMAMLGKLNILGLVASEDSTFRETNVYGSMDSTEYEKGRDAINFLEPGSRVEKPTGDQANQTWQAINILERQFRVVAGYPVAQDGQSPNSFATGEGIKQLGASADDNVREYQTAIKHSVELIDRKRLEWDEVMNPRKTKKVFWYEGGNQFEETYVPEIDIAKDYRTKRIYGAMATFDETQKLLAGLQLLGAGVIDTRTLQENLDGFDNISLINERMLQDKMESGLIASMANKAAQGDPRGDMAMLEVYKKPGKIEKVLTKYFTPEAPEMSPEQMAMAGMGGMGMPPGGGDPEAEGELGSPQSVQTVMSLMEGEGGGVQTVART
jgi:hypothetical protein